MCRCIKCIWVWFDHVGTPYAHRIEYIAHGSDLEGEGGEGGKDGGVEGLDQLQDVGLVGFQFGLVLQARRIHLVVLVTCLDKGQDEWSYNRLKVVESKGLETRG